MEKRQKNPIFTLKKRQTCVLLPYNGSEQQDIFRLHMRNIAKYDSNNKLYIIEEIFNLLKKDYKIDLSGL